MPNRTRSIVAYTAPFIAFMVLLGAGQAIESAFTHSESFLLAGARYWIYPVQTILCGGVLWWFWSSYSLRKPGKIGLTLFIAIIILAVWISPQELFHQQGRYEGFNPTLFQDRPVLYGLTLLFRFARLVIVVPLVEEIFWRGFLLRFMIREDFESVPPQTFTWMSFVSVTLCFGLAHWGPDFIPALITGALLNILYNRTRSLSSCVVAHGVTNLGLGIYIMVTRQWGFW